MATRAFGEEHRILSVGKAFTRGFETVRALPLQTLGTMFVLTTIPGLLFQLMNIFPTSAEALTQGWAGISVSLIIGGGLGFALLWCIALGAVIQATVAHAENRQPDLSEIIGVGVVRCVPLLIVYLLYWIGVSFASVLLIVPGIFLALVWSVATVAIVAERPGIFGAFGRSAELTKGARWKILGLFLAMFVIYIIVAGIAGVVTVASGVPAAALGAAPRFGVGQIIVALINTVVMTWLTAIYASLFLELREWKEGPDTEQLGDIFA